MCVRLAASDAPVECSLVFNVPAFFATFAAIRFGPMFSFASRTLVGLSVSLLSLIAVPVACKFLSVNASMAIVFVLVFFSS